MFFNMILLAVIPGMQPPLDSSCPEDCMVDFGNGICAIRVENCDTGTATVMYGACFTDPCGCNGSECNCDVLRYEVPGVQPATIGHQGPTMYSNYDLVARPAVTAATIGNVIGYDDWTATHVGNAKVEGTIGGGDEYYAMFKVSHATLSRNYYLGVRISDGTTGDLVMETQDLHANSDGNVMERALLYSYTENMQSKTFWFHAVGAGGATANAPGSAPVPQPDKQQSEPPAAKSETKPEDKPADDKTAA
jgi:hypothetical protein